MRESVVLLITAVAGVLAWLLLRRRPGDAEPVRVASPPSPRDGGGRPAIAPPPASVTTTLPEPVSVLEPAQPTVFPEPVTSPLAAGPVASPVRVRNSRAMAGKAANSAGAGRFGRRAQDEAERAGSALRR